MNFKLQKNELSQALGTVNKATAIKSTIKALESVLFTLSANEMKLTGYDLEQGIETTIGAESFDSGTFLVNGELLNSMIKKMPNEDIDFNIDNNILTVSSGKSNMSLPIASEEEYPSLPEFEETSKITLLQETLSSMINQSIFAVATNDMKPVLTGELFEIYNNQLNVVAIDGYRMAMKMADVNAEDTKIIIPSKCLQNVAKILKNGTCDICISQKYVKFVIGDYSVFTRLLEGEYHNYKANIPQASVTEVTLKTKDLTDCLGRCELLINDRIKSPIKCKFENGLLSIDLKTTIGRMSDKIDCEITGGKIEIGFNVKYLLDALKAIDDENVTLFLNGSNSPMLIKGDNYTYLVLPVRLKNE
jgi:DNA polymerase-3 subunit beta